MIELALVAMAALVALWQMRKLASGRSTPLGVTPRQLARIARMSDYAGRLYREKQYRAAEKAYLELLKLDHKNVTAYSHLGIIYSTQKNLEDAIECFEIAARLGPSAATYQNLGLVYFENKNYIKAAASFEKAILYEPTVSRYIGLSKSYHMLRDEMGVITALERAANLEPGERVLQMLSDAYLAAGRADEATAALDRIHPDRHALAPGETVSVGKSPNQHA